MALVASVLGALDVRERAIRRWWWLIALAIVATAFVGAYVWEFAALSNHVLSSNTEDWAKFGEYIGGAFAMLAFVGVLVTLTLQRRQLDLQLRQVTLDELMRLS